MGGALWAVNPAPASPLGLCRARGALVCQGEPWCAEGNLGVPRGALLCRRGSALPLAAQFSTQTQPPHQQPPRALLGAEPPLEWRWLEVSVPVLVPRPLREGSGQRQQHRGKRSVPRGAAVARGSSVPGPRGTVVALGWELDGVRAAGPAPSPAALTAPRRAQGIWWFQVGFCAQKPPPATRVGAHRGGWALREGRAPSSVRDRAAGAQRNPPLIKALPPPAPPCPLLAPPSLTGCPGCGGAAVLGGVSWN